MEIKLNDKEFLNAVSITLDKLLEMRIHFCTHSFDYTDDKAAQGSFKSISTLENPTIEDKLMLGLHYLDGYGTNPDIKKAISIVSQLYDTAKDDIYSPLFSAVLGLIYEEEGDLDTAISFYKESFKDESKDKIIANAGAKLLELFLDGHNQITREEAMSIINSLFVSCELHRCSFKDIKSVKMNAFFATLGCAECCHIVLSHLADPQLLYMSSLHANKADVVDLELSNEELFELALKCESISKDTELILNLAKFYEVGFGTAINLEKTANCYRKAILGINSSKSYLSTRENAINNLFILHKNGSIDSSSLKKDLRSIEYSLTIIKDCFLSSRYPGIEYALTLLAQDGSEPCQIRLAKKFNIDEKQRIEYLAMAGNEGDLEAMEMLAVYYLSGHFVDHPFIRRSLVDPFAIGKPAEDSQDIFPKGFVPNYELARFWLEKIYIKCNKKTTYPYGSCLARFYEDGLCGKKSAWKARRIRKKEYDPSATIKSIAARMRKLSDELDKHMTKKGAK